MKYLNLLVFFLICLTVSAASAANALTEAAVFDESGQPGELAYLGIAIQRKLGQQQTEIAGIHEAVEIVVTIAPAASQLGRTAEIYLIAQSAGQYYAADSSGSFQSWDGDINTLTATREDQVLEAEVSLTLFEGAIPFVTEIDFYLGYSMAGESALYYTPLPTHLEIGNPVEIALELNQSLAGVDYTQLQTVTSEAQELPYLHSLLVSKGGQLVLESYFDGGNAETLRHVRSVTKSITAMAVGRAIEQSVFSGVEQTLGSFQGEHIPALTADKAAVQIRHLLAMISGFDWNESGGTLYDQWSGSGDPVGFLLSRNLVAMPGTAFAYNSAAVNLFSPMVSTVTSAPYDEFVRNELLSPLQIDSVSFELLGNGLPNAAGGMQIRSKDLMKLGGLILNKGLYRDEDNQVQRLINSAWLDDMVVPRVIINEQYGDFNLEYYANLWWIASAGELEVYLAWGWAGQFLAVIPELDVVIVTNAAWENTGAAQASLQERSIASLIVNQVLPAFTNP